MNRFPHAVAMFSTAIGLIYAASKDNLSLVVAFAALHIGSAILATTEK